jgi:pimeloyl-ACP methyl ester carboxylesterase
MPTPTVVLVHGAFAESAGWNGVLTRLQAAGLVTIAAPNHLRSLSGDVQSVRAVVQAVDGPVVLVGHSYGGSVISGAALGIDAVRALVFVAAFAPREGESIAQLSGEYPGSTLGETLETIPLPDGSTDLRIRQELFHQQFAADVPAADAAVAAATQRPLRDVALNEGAGAPAWTSVPSWFVIAGADLNIPPAAQRWMAERADAREVVEVDGASHSVHVSHPDDVADTILRAVKATS